MHLGVDMSIPLCYNIRIGQNKRANKMQELNVHFVNRGYGTDDGIKSVQMISLGICEFTSRPEATIKSPYAFGDPLKAQFVDNEWLCDLD